MIEFKVWVLHFHLYKVWLGPNYLLKTRFSPWFSTFKLSFHPHSFNIKEFDPTSISVFKIWSSYDVMTQILRKNIYTGKFQTVSQFSQNHFFALFTLAKHPPIRPQTCTIWAKTDVKIEWRYIWSPDKIPYVSTQFPLLSRDLQRLTSASIQAA